MLQKIFSIVVLLTALLLFDRSVVGGETTFGSRQIEQLLDDRPDFQTILVPGSKIYEWIANAFDGKFLGERIFWDAREPPYNVLGCYGHPTIASPAHVQVTSDNKITPFDRLAVLVFELHNVQNSRESIELDMLAMQGGIGREQYADKQIKLELRAHSKVARFLTENPIPNAKGEEYEWMTSSTPSLKEYKASFDRPRERGEKPRSNFVSFGMAWDRLVKRD
jgi:hypothetical protein